MNEQRLVQTAEKVLRAEQCSESCELSVLLVDDETIQGLNRAYLGKDAPTDVISFYQNEPGETGDVLGDVVISVETAERQSREYGETLDEELEVLLGHGILHLLGYTDYTEEMASRMAERLEEILGRPIGR